MVIMMGWHKHGGVLVFRKVTGRRYTRVLGPRWPDQPTARMQQRGRKIYDNLEFSFWSIFSRQLSSIGPAAAYLNSFQNLLKEKNWVYTLVQIIDSQIVLAAPSFVFDTMSGLFCRLKCCFAGAWACFDDTLLRIAAPTLKMVTLLTTQLCSTQNLLDSTDNPNNSYWLHTSLFFTDIVLICIVQWFFTFTHCCELQESRGEGWRIPLLSTRGVGSTEIVESFLTPRSGWRP